jgi:two-component system chemotaxis response regulator CheY
MRVLVVDDSLTAGRMLTTILENLGHTVLGQARTGTDAVRMVKELKPELLFLDIVMPELDGLSALRLIHKTAPNVSVFIVSSLGGVGGQVKEALRLGAKAVLTKPVSAEAIAQALHDNVVNSGTA